MKRLLAFLMMCLLSFCIFTGCSADAGDLEMSQMVTADEYKQILESFGYDVAANVVVRQDDPTTGITWLQYTEENSNIQLDYALCANSTDAEELYNLYLQQFKDIYPGSVKAHKGTKACWKTKTASATIYCELYLVDNMVLFGYMPTDNDGMNTLINIMQCLRKTA